MGVYRLYMDEAGDHASSHPEDVGKRYLGLVGVVVEKAAYATIQVEVDQLKRKHLPYDPDEPPILHREDIVQRRGAFSILRAAPRRAAFDRDLLELIRRAPFRVIAVVIDKAEHGRKKYRQLRHPYHYCMLAMLERYCGWLKLTKNRGDVLAESRGGREDNSLKIAYEGIYRSGGYYLLKSDVQETLTSKNIKIKPKCQNIAGLQLADLLAHPLTRDVLVAYKRIGDRGSPFADEVARAAEVKYNRQMYDGRVNGYGRVILA